MNNGKTIDTQKYIATELLHILECVDPCAILAGGAPRDWYFNKPANEFRFLHPRTEGDGEV